MNYKKLEKLNKLYFTCQDVADIFGMSLLSSHVFCNRYIKNGCFIRLKRNKYIFTEKWKTLTKKDFYFLANMLQVPSYISLSSALGYYDITSQIQQNYLESIAVKRTVKKEIKNQIFNYIKINPELYFGFVKIDNFFIASKEKAFLDAVYLVSFNKYKLDFSAIDFDKLNKKIIKKWINKFPERTINFLNKLWKI